MIPLNPWEHQNLVKALYSRCVETICVKHRITRMELDILLFLANNPCFDTASDMIEVRHLSKSQVSASIKLLEQYGYLEKQYKDGNRKTAHLKIRSSANDIIRDGKAAQEQFASILLKDFSVEEIQQMEQYNQRILNNISSYLKEDKHV